VLLGYRSSSAEAAANVEAIVSCGSEAAAAKLDVTDEDSVAAFVNEAIERFGSIDILVNTAGRIDARDAVRFDALSPGDLQDLLEVDVVGTVRMCKAVIPHMRAAGRGSIVNFSGSYGNGVDKENLVNSVAVGYSTAKGAIRGLTASLARDCSPEIRVNAIAPGAIAANWDADWGIPAEHLDDARRMTQLDRFGNPEEIAEAVLFLASDGGGYTTGQVLHVDGGWMMPG
jgi:NAD(P)-dependent dehydrogenase (short-subunit alcohol dehydrogenase family)